MTFEDLGMFTLYIFQLYFTEWYVYLFWKPPKSDTENLGHGVYTKVSK